MSSPLPPFEKKDIFRRSAHQATRAKANRADNVQVSGDLEMTVSEVGKTLHHEDPPAEFVEALAIIIPPESSTYTYTDPRYRCRLQRINFGTSSEDIIKLIDLDDTSLIPEGGTSPGTEASPVGFTVTATNTGEITDPTTGGGTHSLPEDSTIVVQLKGYYDRVDGQPSRLRWVFTYGGLQDDPEFAGLVKQGVANGVAGYALLPFTNNFA